MQRSAELMTWAETAVVLGCSVRTLQRLRASGQIGFTSISSTVYFMPSDVTEYIESQRTQPSPAGRKERARRAS